MEFGFPQIIRIVYLFSISFVIIFIPAFTLSFLFFRRKVSVGKIVLCSAIFAAILGAVAVGFLLYRISTIYKDLNI